MYQISNYIRIRQSRAFRQQELQFSSATTSFAEFSEQFYREHIRAYPKFHKMDNLCKLGVMGADILLKNNTLTEKYDPFDLGIILSNRNSSLDTDLKHHLQSQTGPASPAVFVYSLPNIVIGEICIRHGIKGENTFFIENDYNIIRQVEYITQLFRSGTLKACIGGWVELLDDEYDCFLFLAESDSANIKIPFTAEEIRKLYTHTDE